ncbi:MAG: dephospho-CoA kinase [Tidjanibacter sp.]|nr:dephospho-CoA kinase [Tidjanibacter sp.]
MKRVAVTGGIGSGKSTFCALLSELSGAPVYDSDQRAKELMNTHPRIVADIKDIFGPEAYTAEGVLNRAHIAAVAFADKAVLGRLNEAVHPRVVADFEEWAEGQQSSYVILESALLFTSPLMGHYDLAVVVDAPLEVRVERAVRRDGASREQILARMNNQMSPAEMSRLADHTVLADGVESLRRQAAEIDAIVRKM